MSFTLCTSGAILFKAGKKAESVSGAFLANACDEAEAMLFRETGKDWVADVATLKANALPAIAEVVSAQAAIDVIEYNMARFTSRAEAQTMLDILDNKVTKGIKALADTNVQKKFTV